MLVRCRQRGDLRPAGRGRAAIVPVRCSCSPPDDRAGDPTRVDGEPLVGARPRAPARCLHRRLPAYPARPCRREAAARRCSAATQAKTALLRHGGRWCRPRGATPSTHILKLPLGARAGRRTRASAPRSRTNGCAASCCAPSASTVAASRTRGDRSAQGAGDRSHRPPLARRSMVGAPADGGLLPGQRHAAAALRASRPAGPDIGRMLDLLRGSEQAATDRERLLAAMVVMWLLAVPELSGKRFAIRLLSGGRFVLGAVVGRDVGVAAAGALAEGFVAAALAVDAVAHRRCAGPPPDHAPALARARRGAMRWARASMRSWPAWPSGPGRRSTAAAASLPAGFASSVSEPVFDGPAPRRARAVGLIARLPRG